jgi:NAD(P)-dependent dehydrogenase (short-subunit alcohol dehydrogenase family)
MQTEPEWASGIADEADLKKRAMQAILAGGEKPTPMAINRLCQRILSQRQIQETLDAIVATGSRVEYLPVDVTDTERLRSAIVEVEQRVGQITGIIHGAGNLADKLIERKTEQDFETVYAAKVGGLENLLQCVPPERLEHLVLFSSVAGFYGNAGQADYALANEILNKSAHLVKRKYPNCHVVSVNWGPWDSGMVTPELKRVFKQRKINVIPLDVGAQMLVDELAIANQHVSQVVIGSAITPSAVESDPTLRDYRVRRRLSLDANPFLQDYRVDNTPMLPPTVAAAWLIQACEQRYPGYRFVRLDNFQVLNPIRFDRADAAFVMVDVKETAKQADAIEFEVSVWSEGGGRVTSHYQGKVAIAPTLTADQSVQTVPLNAVGTPGAALYQNGTLFQGPSFQAIEQVRLVSSTTVALGCVTPAIDDAAQGQFPIQSFNPFAMDAIAQAMALWCRQQKRPVDAVSGFSRIEQFKKLENHQHYELKLEITQQTAANVTANITVHGGDGEIYLQASGVYAATLQPALVSA